MNYCLKAFLILLLFPFFPLLAQNQNYYHIQKQKQRELWLFLQLSWKKQLVKADIGRSPFNTFTLPASSLSAPFPFFSDSPYLKKTGFCYLPGLKRGSKYLCYIPSLHGKQKKKNMPLFIILHSFGQSPYEALLQWKKIADQQGILLLAPHTLFYSWNREPDKLILDPLQSAHFFLPLDPKAIYLAGSQEGGAGVFYWGSKMASLFSGLVILHGLPYHEGGQLDLDQIRAISQTPVYFVHPSPPLQVQVVWKEISQKEASSLYLWKTSFQYPDFLSWLAKSRTFLPSKILLYSSGEGFHFRKFAGFWAKEKGFWGKIERKGQKILIQSKKISRLVLYFEGNEKKKEKNKKNPKKVPYEIYWNGKRVFSGRPYNLSLREKLFLLEKIGFPRALTFQKRILLFPSISPEGMHTIQDLHSLKIISKFKLHKKESLLPMVDKSIEDLLSYWLWFHSQKTIREMAALRLGKRGKAPILANSYMKEPETTVKQAILRGLGFCRDKMSFLFVFLKALKEKDENLVQEGLEQILPLLRKGRKKILSPFLNHPSSKVRRTLAMGLLAEEDLPWLKKLSQDSHWMVREGVCRSLGKRRDGEELLLKLLEDSSSIVARSAKEALHQRKLIQKGIDPAKIQSLHFLAEGWLVKKDWKKAKDLYLQILKLDPHDNRALYNLACVECHMNQATSAFIHLLRSVLSGFDDSILLQKDPDLRPLRNLPQYKKFWLAFQKRDFPMLAKILQ
ncbi:MAG: hypothetical protein D6785_09940, partial [Planctomycetota bacterium]